jgi:hypothetical protein
MPGGIYRTGADAKLGVLGLEEAQKGCMLGEEGLDLGDAGAGPVLKPSLAEIVFDPVEAALTHRP